MATSLRVSSKLRGQNGQWRICLCLIALVLGLLIGAGLQIPSATAQTPPINLQSIKCPSCPVMEAVTKGALALTDDMTDLMVESLQGLVMAALGVWMLLQVAKLLFPFGPLDRVPNTLNSVTGMIILAIGVMFVLGSADLYKRYILHPIIAASINASNVILSEAISVTSQATSTTPARNPNPTPAAAPQLPPITMTADLDTFDTQVSVALVEHVKTVHETLQKGICLGISNTGLPGCMNETVVQKNAQGKSSWIDSGIKTIMDLGQKGIDFAKGSVKFAETILKALDQNEAGRLFTDLLIHIIAIFGIIIVYGLVWVKYPLYVLDVVMKWAVLSILWPLMAAAMLLPATRPSAFSALKGLGHAALTLVFLAAVIGTSLSVIDQMWNELEWAQGKDVTINKQTIGHHDYWLAVITGLVMLFLMKECPKMAGAFIDSSMDLRVGEGLWGKMKELVWLAADVATAGKAGRFKRALNIK
jgi:hypothetical protein